MYEHSIKILERKNIKLEEGLNYEQINNIKKVYGIIFPKTLEMFLMTVLPVSEGFYNWRDFSNENVKKIKEMINYPQQYISSMVDEIEWNDKWGREPNNDVKRNKIINDRLKEAPQLIPFFSHRYIPNVKDDNPPIISIHGSDIIYYGKDLVHYIEEEFGDIRGDEIDAENFNYIQFWSDIM